MLIDELFFDQTTKVVQPLKANPRARHGTSGWARTSAIQPAAHGYGPDLRPPLCPALASQARMISMRRTCARQLRCPRQQGPSAPCSGAMVTLQAGHEGPVTAAGAPARKIKPASSSIPLNRRCCGTNCSWRWKRSRRPISQPRGPARRLRLRTASPQPMPSS